MYFKERCKPSIRCHNCKQVFSESEFLKHICDYDEKGNFIILSEEKDLNTSSENNEPICARLLRENQIKIRRFLRDDLKMDVSGSSNLSKKQDGKHECTMCERKFVHASGLSRHMEKHALDLIPSTNNQVGVGLRVVVKCLVCGVINYEPDDALMHLFNWHCSLKDDVDELRNFGDIPYENFVNEALIYMNTNGFRFQRSEVALSEKKYFMIVVTSSLLQCEFCDMCFTEVSHLLNHTAYHEPERGFECLSCEVAFKSSKEIFLHWQADCVFSRERIRKNYNLQKFYVCNVCENKFSTCEQLHEHR